MEKYEEHPLSRITVSCHWGQDLHTDFKHDYLLHVVHADLKLSVNADQKPKSSSIYSSTTRTIYLLCPSEAHWQKQLWGNIVVDCVLSTHAAVDVYRLLNTLRIGYNYKVVC